MAQTNFQTIADCTSTFPRDVHSADVAMLTIEHTKEPLAQYTATPEPDHKHRKDVVPLRLFENRFPSLQLMLWEPNAVEWRLVFHRPQVTRRSRPTVAIEQGRLFSEIAV